ncbi:MAG: DUF3429 domain-containing protein [Pseudomonadota bacterium]
MQHHDGFETRKARPVDQPAAASSPSAGATAAPRHPANVPLPVWALGLSGLIPFVALSASLVIDTGINRSWATLALLTYGAIILSFMSGVHWGLAMRGPLPDLETDDTIEGSAPGTAVLPYAMSVLPALAGWFAVITLNPGPAMAVIAASFAALLAYDLRMINQRFAPRWYAVLRFPLTVVVVLSLLVGGWAGAYGI